MNRRVFFKIMILRFRDGFVLSLLPSFFVEAKEGVQAKKIKTKKTKELKPIKEPTKESVKKSIKELRLIDEQDTLAKAMQYRHSANQSSLRTNKRAYCYNCSKYNLCMGRDRSCEVLSSKQLREGTEAPCQIFKGRTVAKMGWCLSWQAKTS